MRACWLLLLLPTVALATLMDEQAAGLKDSPLLARVRIAKSQTLDVSTRPQGIRLMSFHDAEVLECSGCGLYRPSEPIRLSTFGGSHQGLAQKVVGAPQLFEGEEVWVELERKQNAWQAHVVMERAPPSAATSTTGYTCTYTWTEGPSLYWPERQVRMRPARIDDPRLSLADLQDAMQWAGDQWSSAPGADFSFSLGEPTTQAWIGYDWSTPGRNQNIVTVRRHIEGDPLSDWLHQTHALATTSLTFVPSTGQIVDADIEINAERFWFTNCELPCETHRDLKNNLTHEYGHVLGLSHTEPGYPDARRTAMFASTHEGERQKRHLSAPDQAGVSFLYPVGAKSPNCRATPRPKPLAFKVEAQAPSCRQGFDGLAFACLLFVLRRPKTGIRTRT